MKQLKDREEEKRQTAPSVEEPAPAEGAAPDAAASKPEAPAVPAEKKAKLKKPRAEKAPKQKKPMTKKKKKLIIWLSIIAVIVILIALAFRSCSRAAQAMMPSYTYVQAERRNITDALTGSGVLEPADSYNVTTLVSGDILAASFEDGDIVTKGDVLYEIDSSKASTSIERAEIALSQSQRNYSNQASSQSDLTVSAPIGGVLTGFTTEVGDSVNMRSPIATIEDTGTLTLTEYYANEYSGSIYAGMGATVSVPDHMLNLRGTVKEVSSLTRVSDTGVVCFAVTVEVQNPGSLTSGTDATCWLDGDIYPSVSDDNGLDAASRKVIYAGVSGTVTSINVRNNETVTAGTLIMQMSSDDVTDQVLSAADSLRDAQISLQSQYDALEDYTITAPIDGTIVEKSYKEGEKCEMGKSLCVIYDLSSLNLTLNVDELDISNVKVGQTATVTADAVEGVEYTGVVTRVGVNGTSASGVTTYPVDIRIDVTDGLLPGMSVDVSIIVEEKENVVAIPADAVERSGRVLVKTADGTTGEGAPEGYNYVEITTGVSDDDYVEVLSGLSETDTVAYMPKTVTVTDIYSMMYGEAPQGGGPGGGDPDMGGY